MSSDLSPEARSLLAVAREGEEMPAADKARHRKQLLAQIAVASAAGAGATLAAKSVAAKAVVLGASVAPAAAPIAAGAATAAGTVAGVSIFTKIAGVVVMAGLIGGGAIGVKSLSSDSAVRVAAGPVTATAQPIPPRATPTQAGATESLIQRPAATNEAPRDIAQPVPSLVGRKVDTPIAAASPSNAKARESSLEDETLLLRGAHEALESGNASRALAMLDEHARRYPHGILVEERGAQRIFALCALGSAARARSEAAIFLSERPNSPLATRVRNSCVAK